VNHELTPNAFFKALRETWTYFFDIGGLFAGFLVASQLRVFDLSSWAIAVYPAILTAKGVTGGMLSGRLASELHVGTLYPRLFRNTRGFYRLLEAMIAITVVVSVVMSSFSVAFGSLFWGITPADFLDILTVVLATMTLGLIVSLITTNAAFITFEKGLDPDATVYPIMSTVADIFITVFYVVTLKLFFGFGSLGRFAVILIGLIPIVITLCVLPRGIHEEEFVKTIKEPFLALIFVAFIANFTGTIFKRIEAVAGGRLEIYTVYPALMAMTGDVDSVVSSTATTKFALGLSKPSFSSIRNQATQVFSVWTVSIIIYLLFSVLSLLMNGEFALYSFLRFTSLLLVVNVIAIAAIVLVSYAMALLTFQKSLDPDNVTTPVESSLADSITTIALLGTLLLIG
jgi:mgtE-like transporter